MRCGSCSNQHDTVAEVRSCYSSDLPKRSALPTFHNGPSEAQTNFIKKLANEVGDAKYTDDHIAQLTGGGKGTASAAIEDLLATAAANRQQGGAKVGGAPSVKTDRPIPQYRIVTVVMDDGERRTLRFHTPRQGNFKGTTLVKYLAGPNNEDDYVTFGNVVDGGIRIWSRYQNDSLLVRCLTAYLSADDEVRKQMGLDYAVDSGNCSVCGRLLTVPASISAGIGPVCEDGGLIW